MPLPREPIGPLDPADIAELTLVVRFDYVVAREPLRVSWPVTRQEADRLHDWLATFTEDHEPFMELRVNRVRRDVWLNLERVREVNMVNDYLSEASLPATLEKDPEDLADEREMERAPDLYPLVVLAFRGSEHSYDAGKKWLELSGVSPEDVAELTDVLEREPEAAFLRFMDDDGEYRFVRKRDVAFVDAARVVRGAGAEARFAAEGSAA